MQCLKKIRNRIWTHNHLVCKRTLNHLAKLEEFTHYTEVWGDKYTQSEREL